MQIGLLEIVGVGCRVFPDDMQLSFRYSVGMFDARHVENDLKGEYSMPRYLVERTFPDGLALPANEQGTQACLMVVGNNAVDGVTWVHSYVAADKKKTFCIYDAPSPEAIRSAAQRNNLPVDRIKQVSVLDPYFYQ